MRSTAGFQGLIPLNNYLPPDWLLDMESAEVNSGIIILLNKIIVFSGVVARPENKS